jgi:hypothetical protein
MKIFKNKPCAAGFIIPGILIFQILGFGYTSATVEDEYSAGLGQWPCSVHSFLYEVTFFKIDVAMIEYQLDQETATRTAAISEKFAFNEFTLEKVGNIFFQAETIAFSMDLQRDASCGRVLKGMLSNLERARESGVISKAEHELVSTGLPGLLAPHEERGVLEGDILMFRVQPDGVRVILLGVDGTVLVDSLESGSAWTQGIKGIFLGRGSKLREHVVEAAWDLD